MNSVIYKYLVAGSLAFSADISILYLCTEMLGVHYLVSNLYGYCAGVLVAYVLNANWVFTERVYADRRKEFLLFNVIVITGLLISEIMMSLFVEIAGLGYLTAKVVSSGFVMVSNFVGKKIFLFHSPTMDGSTPVDSPNTCPNCGEKSAFYESTRQGFDAITHGSTSSFDLLKCTSCLLTSTSMESVPSLSEYYPESYYGGGSGKFLRAIEFFLKLMAVSKGGRILKIWSKHFARNSGNVRILDVGCGRAILLRALQRAGAEVTGLERPEFPLDKTCAEIVELKSLAELSTENREFDIGILWHVLEHIDSPSSALRDLSSNLSKTGMLVVAVPNFSSLQSRIFGPYWFHLDLPRHLVHIESEWLINAIEALGYEIVKQSHFDLLQNTYGFIQSAMNLCFPSHPNAYYLALKQGEELSWERIKSVACWSMFAMCLLPFALIELVVSTFKQQGATVQIQAVRP